MTLFKQRLQLAHEIATLKDNHDAYADKQRELCRLTTKQIKRELRWGWLRKYKLSEQTIRLIGIAIGSAMYVGGMVMHVWMGMN